jgi:peptidoglycan/xylan/chitin deacetylase (PgdA/CDA1 family)
MIFKIIAAITLLSILPAVLAAGLIAPFSPFSAHKQSFLFSFILFLLLIDGILIFAVLERRAPIFGRIFWKGLPGSNRICLTFDDGPNEPFTSELISVLNRYGVRATFFLIGSNCERFPDSVKAIHDAGHVIGNHTWSHEVLPLKLPSSVREEIMKTSVLIEKYTGQKPAFFRAPHGWRNPWVDRIARQSGCTPVAWTLGVWDTDRPGAENIVRRTLQGVTDGCILLLHDGRGTKHRPDSSQLVQALPAILEELRRCGYRFVTLPELMETTAR